MTNLDTTVDPLRDPQRLAEIAALDLHSLEADAILDETVRTAAAHFGLPSSMVSIVLDGAQFFAAMHGVTGWISAARGTPVEWSFCKTPTRTQQDFVVEDATTHPTMKDSPLVTVEGQRCYAGVPLTTSRGVTVGAFCVTGTEAREFTAEEIEELHGFARAAMDRIETRRR